MKNIAFHIQKGGVGKTSLSGNIAYLLSKKGKTCLVDCDPQGNASSWYSGELFRPEKELADALLGKCTIKETIFPLRDNFYLIPTFGLDGDLKMYGETQLANEPFIFDDVTEELKKLGFDFVVFDLSPGMGRLEKAVALAMNEIVVPMMPDSFGLDGIEIFTNELAKLGKAYRRPIRHGRIVVNRIDHRITQQKEILSKIPDDIKSYHVPVDPAFHKAQAVGQSIFELPRADAPKKETVEALEQLSEDLWR